MCELTCNIFTKFLSNFLQQLEVGKYPERTSWQVKRPSVLTAALCDPPPGPGLHLLLGSTGKTGLPSVNIRVPLTCTGHGGK